MLKFKNQKGQSRAGLVAGLIFGVASLVIGVIIAFVVVNTLIDADLLTSGRVTTTVNIESGWLNTSGYELTGYDKVTTVPTSIAIVNVSNGTDGVLIPSGNYSLLGGTIFNVTTTDSHWLEADGGVNITYTYSNYSTEEKSTNALNTNFTKGIDNVSGKIPTVLLVAVIVLILGVLVLLVGAWQRMRLGGGGI